MDKSHYSTQTMCAVPSVVCAEVVVAQTISGYVARGRKLYLYGCAVESGSGKTGLTTFFSSVSVSHFANDIAFHRQRVCQMLKRTTSVARYKYNINYFLGFLKCALHVDVDQSSSDAD